MAMKASAAPRSTSHSVVNAIVLICALRCFTFAVRSIVLILSVFGTPFYQARQARTGACLPWVMRRAGH